MRIPAPHYVMLTILLKVRGMTNRRSPVVLERGAQFQGAAAQLK